MATDTNMSCDGGASTPAPATPRQSTATPNPPASNADWEKQRDQWKSTGDITSPLAHGKSSSPVAASTPPIKKKLRMTLDSKQKSHTNKSATAPAAMVPAATASVETAMATVTTATAMATIPVATAPEAKASVKIVTTSTHPPINNNITGPLADGEPTSPVDDQPTKMNMRKKPDPNLTSGKGKNNVRYTFQDKFDFIEKVNALGPNPSAAAIGDISATTQSGAEMKPHHSLINTWKQERKHNEHKRMIELGFGDRVQRPKDAKIIEAQSQLASRRDPGFLFNRNNSPPPDSRAKFDNFIPSPKGRYQSMFRSKFKGVSTPINGSMMVNINFKDKKKCDLEALRGVIPDAPPKEDWNSLVDNRLLLFPQLKHMNLKADYGSLLLNLDKEEGSTPQPRHADYWSQPGYNKKLGKVIQGVIALTDNCEATQAYDISNVPENPSRDDFVEQLDKMKPLPQGTFLRELLVKDETPGEMSYVDRWSRIVYSTNDDQPQSDIVMPKFSTMVMCGNHPHRGPGSKHGKFWLMLFFTARPADDTETESYDNTQMTKEKLFLIFLNNSCSM